MFLYYKYFLSYEEKQKKNRNRRILRFLRFSFFYFQTTYIFRLLGIFWLKTSKVWQLVAFSTYLDKKMSVFSAQLVDIFFRYLSVKQKKKKKIRDFLYVLVCKSKSIYNTAINIKHFKKISWKELSKEVLYVSLLQIFFDLWTKT